VAAAEARRAGNVLLAGVPQPPSHLHMIYGGAEILKTAALLFIGTSGLAGVLRESRATTDV
jgi:hypothetical protein